MSELTEKELFETVPVPRAVARLIIPTITSQIVTVIYNLADTFFIGQIGDPAMVAGATLGDLSMTWYTYISLRGRFGRDCELAHHAAAYSGA